MPLPKPVPVPPAIAFERHVRKPGRITFEVACHRFPNRFTMEHVPAWAMRPLGDGLYPAPAYRSDREWYAASVFYGEPDHDGPKGSCVAKNPTWPLGLKLRTRFVPSPYLDA